MAYMLSFPLLSNTNRTKLLELDEELASQLQEAVSGHSELDTATFSTEEIETLTGLTTRLARMAERRDLTDWVEDTDGGKKSNAWEMLSALMERGRLGRKEEETVSSPPSLSLGQVAILICSSVTLEQFITNAIQLLTLHVAWKASKLRTQAPLSGTAVTLEQETVEGLRKQRDYLVEQFADFVAGGQSNTTNSVKRTVSLLRA